MTVFDSPGPLLDGRTALVTGGCRGIGGAVTRSFVHHGANVLCADIDVADEPMTRDEARQAPGSLRIMELDITATHAAAAVEAAVEPDVIVNNVGDFLRPPKGFVEETATDWDDMFRVNVDHVLALTSRLLPGMVSRGRGGSVITMTTVEAHRAIPGHAVYSAANAALTAWSRSVALEHGPHGIRFNTIAPDLIETPQVPYRKLVPEQDRWRWRMWAPLGRHGAPDEVAGAALFLASDLSSFVTGTTIHVDGGSHAAGGWFARETGGWTNRPYAP